MPLECIREAQRVVDDLDEVINSEQRRLLCHALQQAYYASSEYSDTETTNTETETEDVDYEQKTTNVYIYLTDPKEVAILKIVATMAVLITALLVA